MDRYLVVFVPVFHALFAFVLRNNLSCVFDNDLVWLKCTIASDTVSPICCLDDFDADVVLPALFVALLETFKGPIVAVIGADVAVCVVAFVEHVPVQAVVITTCVWCADTARRF